MQIVKSLAIFFGFTGRFVSDLVRKPRRTVVSRLSSNLDDRSLQDTDPRPCYKSEERCINIKICVFSLKVFLCYLILLVQSSHFNCFPFKSTSPKRNLRQRDAASKICSHFHIFKLFCINEAQKYRVSIFQSKNTPIYLRDYIFHNHNIFNRLTLAGGFTSITKRMLN